MLLQHENIDVNVKDNSGNTPLHYFSNKEITELLLNHENIDVNAKDNDGRTPLTFKLWLADEKEMERFKMIEMLLNHNKIDVNVTDHSAFLCSKKLSHKIYQIIVEP